MIIMEMKIIVYRVSIKRFLEMPCNSLLILDPPQTGPYFPANVAQDHSNAINVRRHIYSPSQLPQGLTEGQLVMLLQKGSQYQQMKFGHPSQNEPVRMKNSLSQFKIFFRYLQHPQ